MIVIAVANSKGGTGKTTLTSALAVCAAKESKRVAMVDLDPQKSLVAWWKRRGRSENPTIFEGCETAADAVDRLELDGWDWVFLDGPPSYLAVIADMMAAANFVLIPVKPSVVDMLATQDAIALARESGAAYAVVINDAGPKERVVDKARDSLLSFGVPLLETVIVHRVSHITGMTVGKSAAEVNSGRDTAAAEEIDNLWREVKAAATEAAWTLTAMEA
jgi:chromosome partitioning protein